MTFKLYIMSFKNAHFGEGMLNDSGDSFDAGRLYSALFLESTKMNKSEKFEKMSHSKEFYLSDAFPYNDEPFLPKPIGYPNIKNRASNLEELKESRRNSKRVKNINYIPFTEFNNYISGESNVEQISEKQKLFNTTEVRVRKGNDPYEVGVTSFKSKLYVIATQSELLDNLMTSLQYSGIGGKRSSGLGQFELEIASLPKKLEKNINSKENKIQMALASSLPTENEIERVSDGAKYLLKKASGYAYSESVNELLRKQDFYKFRAGSTFEIKYEGNIVDLRPDDFPHPVWHYAKGLFYSFNP